jgi:putative tricarboxylic transport membrane protein
MQDARHSARQRTTPSDGRRASTIFQSCKKALKEWLSWACLSALAAPLAPAVDAEPLYDELRIVAPAAPGGGWDQTARAMQQALQSAGIVTTPVVENVPGAAGTIGLARFIGAERGNGDALLVSGLIMLGGIVTHQSPVGLGDVVPIARLTGEYEVITVPAASPLRTLDELLRRFKDSPESISWGGGSAGGSDQILAGLIAAAVGVDPRRVNYIAFSGGGEALSAVLGGQVTVGINGLAEFLPQIEAGTVRVLSISSAERLPGVDAPTLREHGVDVVLENWRSVVAPPGVAPEDRLQLSRAVEAMARSPEWHEMLARYRWLDRYLAGEAFARFSAAEERRVAEILRRLGTGGAAPAGMYPVVVLAGLTVFGAASVAGRRWKRRRRPISDDIKYDVLDDEYMDNSLPPAGRWRALGWIAAAMLLTLLLAERAGFPLAAAALFWLAARAFDDRRPLRDAVCAVAVALGAYLLFARVLQLALPAGLLERWL